MTIEEALDRAYATPKQSLIACPFCGDTDFDLIGLKIHLVRGWCDKFNKLET